MSNMGDEVEMKEDLECRQRSAARVDGDGKPRQIPRVKRVELMPIGLLSCYKAWRAFSLPQNFLFSPSASVRKLTQYARGALRNLFEPLCNRLWETRVHHLPVRYARAPN